MAKSDVIQYCIRRLLELSVLNFSYRILVIVLIYFSGQNFN